MDTFGTSAWVKFFTDGGIPHSIACNYAVTFMDNRITKNMLLDLNKEILQDMGITLVGDVIAILKHSKVVHDQITRAKVFESEASVAPVLPERRNTLVTQPDYAKRKLASTLTVQPLEQTPVVRPAAAKRGPEPTPEEVSPKKARRVLPEHEGRYRISMPVGLTAKTKRLLEQQNLSSATQVPIFQRLGVQVGTTQSNLKSLKTTTPIVATKKKVKLAASSTKEIKMPASVFARLGPEASSGGEDDSEGGNSSAQQLPYRGILKDRGVVGPSKNPVQQKAGHWVTAVKQPAATPTPLKRTVANKGNSYVATTSEARRAKLAAISSPPAVGASPSFRLGIGSQGILASRKAGVIQKTNVQGRLGAKSRLGPAPQKAVGRLPGVQPGSRSEIPPVFAPVTRKAGGVRPVASKSVVGKMQPDRVRMVAQDVASQKRPGVFDRLGPIVGV